MNRGLLGAGSGLDGVLATHSEGVVATLLGFCYFIYQNCKISADPRAMS